MEEAAPEAPQSGRAEPVLVLSYWHEPPDGALLVRATLSVAGRGADMRRLSSREQVHALLDEWLDGAESPPAGDPNDS
ncbi:hypothetical protein N802_04220 [Knoellia sinensis KCTC 19936]|uniref:Uncharacterized protein n=1 Tax=Knoellia sinensis KCTC 19936 TaxID=1385520 RepID=A0A0A0J1J5_9MICO|nr:hypothetical protein [Knoellia sinensis]KGN31300.1 hypothetical protein N802_04220 [Knoellia sinensis KCTC 19936]